jgi:hypothetical protein
MLAEAGHLNEHGRPFNPRSIKAMVETRRPQSPGFRRTVSMSDTSPHEEAQLLARMTVLELVVGMMVRDSMLKAGKGPQDILGFGEIVKKLLEGRTPRGRPTSNFVKPLTGSFRRSLRILEASPSNSSSCPSPADALIAAT